MPKTVNSNSLHKLFWFLLIGALLLVTFQAFLAFSTSLSESAFGLGSGIVVTLALTGAVALVAVLAFKKGGIYRGLLLSVLSISVLISLFSFNGVGLPQRLVGAYYYTWYPAGGWQVPDRPLLGFYDSGNRTVITQHLAWARQYGVDFFVISLWSNDSGGNSVTFNNTYALFQTNAALHNPLRLCVMVEPKSLAQLNALADEVWNSFVGMDSYLTWQGKPLLLVYTDYISLLARWGDSRFTVRLVPEDIPYFIATPNIQTTFVGDFISVKVGQNKTSAGVYVDRQNGAYYSSQWSFAVAWAKFNPQRSFAVIITSWNEFYEVTNVEPTLAWGLQYLQLTKTYSDLFRKT